MTLRLKRVCSILLALIYFLFSHISVYAQAKSKINYAQHIAPIMVVNCTPCHKVAGAAPFSLSTYNEVRKHAKSVEYVTRTRYMPPWKADPHYTSFANERQLTASQIDLIRRWVADGMVEGVRSNTSLVSGADNRKSVLANKPDLVLRPKQAFHIKGDNEEHFVLFKIPFEISEAHPIRSIEFVAGNKKILHHANFAIQEVAPTIDLSVGADYVVSDQFMSNVQEFSPLMQSLIYYGGWTPGSSAQVFPKGVGFTLPRRGVILLTVHYGPSPIDTQDLSYLNIYFSEAPVSREIQATSIGSAGIGKIVPPLVIQADSIQKFRATITTKSSLSLLYVWPHMHLLGKSFKAWAITPQGENIPLVRIPEWDFRWQEAYRFKKLLYIPSGSVITVEGVYDNTTKNPNNPFSPPRTIISQDLMESRSEMLNLIMLFLPYREGDENKILEMN